MKRRVLFLFFMAIIIGHLAALDPPRVTISNYKQLPASFFKQGDSNTFPCALSYNGNVAAVIQASFTRQGEGKAYHIPSDKSFVFWRNGYISPGKNIWAAMDSFIRLSENGSRVAFEAFLVHRNKTPADPWGAAVIITQTNGLSSPRLYNLKHFLKTQDSRIDGARGITGMDMNADGSILYVTVPYHYKTDGEHARSYPVRVAIIEIRHDENQMILHSTVRKGEQYYPFSTITTNASGRTFSYKGAGPGGEKWFSYIFATQWVDRPGHYQMTELPMTGVNTSDNRGGPVIMGMNNSPYVFLFPMEKGPVIAYNWKNENSLYFGTMQTGIWSMPSYADGRFASYDGDHIFYSAGSHWVWYDLHKKPALLVPYAQSSTFSIPGYNNVFMSADASILLLGETSGNKKRLAVLKVNAP